MKSYTVECINHALRRCRLILKIDKRHKGWRHRLAEEILRRYNYKRGIDKIERHESINYRFYIYLRGGGWICVDIRLTPCVTLE